MTEPRLQHFGTIPFSHGALLSVLKEYRRPNDKIAEWLRQGVLLALKRGQYVLGGSGHAPCRPLVANHLYGPSCASLDYALAWHGVTPERVHKITSVCTGRGRVLDNTLGRFSYTQLPAAVYPCRISQASASPQETFLIGSPAKALCDKVMLTLPAARHQPTRHAALPVRGPAAGHRCLGPLGPGRLPRVRRLRHQYRATARSAALLGGVDNHGRFTSVQMLSIPSVVGFGDNRLSTVELCDGK